MPVSFSYLINIALSVRAWSKNNFWFFNAKLRIVMVTIYQLAGYSAICNTRYPAEYSTSQIRYQYPAGYRISKKGGINCANYIKGIFMAVSFSYLLNIALSVRAWSKNNFWFFNAKLWIIIVKICWSFLRIRIPRFKPDREVNKWLPIKLTLRQNNGFCKGREDKV
jgi:hypothetical protein